MVPLTNKIKFAVLGALFVTCFGRVALHGTGGEYDICRYLVPFFVGGTAGFLVGRMKDKWIQLKENLESIVKDRTIELIDENNKRKQSEQALRKSEEKFRYIIEGIGEIGEGLLIISRDRHVQYMNEVMIEWFGNQHGKICYESIANLDSPCPYCKIEEVIDDKKTIVYQPTIPDGRIFDIAATPFINSDGSISKMEVIRDITGIKKLQDQFIRSERLAATGQLSVSIAHEINSPLQAITFLLNALTKSCDKDKELADIIYTLKGAFRSIRNTVRNLLDLNRPGQNNKQQIKINNVIEKTVALIQSQLKKNKVKINLDLSSEVPDISASPQQLSHLFLNLFNNALEAMTGISKSKKGGMSLKTWREINVKSDLNKGNIVIKVADNGPGISEEDLEYMFDPFYTRKKQMGLGVGLSICNDIIENHGGTIVAENAPYGGAVFTIKLPCLTQSREGARE